MPTDPVLDVATYLSRQYEEPRCFKLVADVYADVLGVSPAEVETVSESMRRAARTFRLELFKRQPGMQQIDQPRDLAVLLMWPADSRKRAHCGIYWQGKVLHATETGNLYQDLASLQDVYPRMEWWAR